MTEAVTAPPDGARPAPPTPPLTVGQDIKLGLLGVAIAVGCLFLFIPVVHEIVTGLGPAIGGFFAGARGRARGKHVLIIAVTIGVGETIGAAIVAAILMVLGTIQADTTTILFAAGVAVAAFFYATALGALGAYFGGRGSDEKAARHAASTAANETAEADRAAHAPTMAGAPASMDDIDPRRLERMVKALLGRMGFAQVQVAGRGDHGEVDLVAQGDESVTGGKVVVLCRPGASEVEALALEELYGRVTMEHASRGMAVTTSSFTADAARFAEGKPLELIDRDRLRQLLEQNGMLERNGVTADQRQAV